MTAPQGYVPRNRLAELRKQHFWTLDEVAIRVGLSKPMVSRLENAKAQLTGYHVERFTRLYGVNPLALYIDESKIIRLDDASAA